MKPDNLQSYFHQFRKQCIGINQTFLTPYGEKKIHYFDWTASGRLYKLIEDRLTEKFGPFVGNTHSESSETGVDMTLSYHIAQSIIRKHINASKNDTLLLTGTGTSAAILKLQRILGLKVSDQMQRMHKFTKLKSTNTFIKQEKPVVFITHMEHHSNQITWEECDVDLVIVPPDINGNFSTENLKRELKKYENRKVKIGSFTACSNVTGILNPVHTLAKIMHSNGGYCFIDFAAAAPYISIDMHPNRKDEYFDAIFFSVHKFLGGPGTPGILVFNNKLYPKKVSPDQPGGGTVLWTNPWGGRQYYDDISLREDGGTPGFLQTIKAALAIKLKEEMNVEKILKREAFLTDRLLKGLRDIQGIRILDDNQMHRLGIISFIHEEIHFNLLVKLLNDRYGIQTRGGCSCAGTYGHCLFHLNKEQSKKITDRINLGDQSTKPGWIRASLHPILTLEEIDLLISAIREIGVHYKKWEKDYTYNSKTNEFEHKQWTLKKQNNKIEMWFEAT